MNLIVFFISHLVLTSSFLKINCHECPLFFKAIHFRNRLDGDFVCSVACLPLTVMNNIIMRSEETPLGRGGGRAAADVVEDSHQTKALREG